MSKNRGPGGGRGERSRQGIGGILSEPQHSDGIHELLPCRPRAALSPPRARCHCASPPSGSCRRVPHTPHSLAAPLVLICNQKHGFNPPAGGSQSYYATPLSAMFGSSFTSPTRIFKPEMQGVCHLHLRAYRAGLIKSTLQWTYQALYKPRPLPLGPGQPALGSHRGRPQPSRHKPSSDAQSLPSASAQPWIQVWGSAYGTSFLWDS